ncbi:MAG TPA: helix-turn-helix transcriptional regulator [Gammaproteobacteria bacterium]|nr:helix-turn-helix transcriptional regulator [Gammaproteobacteria bacterium]
MDMRVDAELIRSERTSRAWSQEHLANAAGLGLRTVQRIESTGLASNESVIALAAVFSIPVSRIQIGESARAPRQRWTGPRRKLGAAGAAVLAIVLSIAAVRSSFADQIVLDIVFSLNDDSQVFKTRMAIEDGQSEELELDSVGRFVLTPSITEEGLILIELEVFEMDGSDYVKTHEPRVMTRYDMPAEIAFGSRESQAVRILLTPEGR